MRVAIITVPERLVAAEGLKKTLTFAQDVTLFVDEEKKGCTWNFRRALAHMIETTPEGEPMMFLTDDAIVSERFEEHFNTIHSKAKQDIYTLCVNQKSFARLPAPDGYYIVKSKGPRFMFSDIGWVIFNNYPNLVEELAEFSEQPLGPRFPRLKRRWAEHHQHHDLELGNFLVSTHKPFALTIPGLVIHNLDMPSTLGHTFNNGRVSFIDYEEQKLTRRWRGPVPKEKTDASA